MSDQENAKRVVDETWVADEIQKKAEELMRFVLKHKEQFIAMFIAEHGCLPSEAVMCEQTTPHEGGGWTTRVWFEKRER